MCPSCRVEDSKILHGPFVPSGKGKVGDQPTRQSLPAILKELHACLDEDWGDYRFSVMSTEDDAVVARFELASVDSERGLHAYMNVMARSGGACASWSTRSTMRVSTCSPCPVRACCRRGNEIQAEEGRGGLAQPAGRRLLVLHVPTAVGALSSDRHVLHPAP